MIYKYFLPFHLLPFYTIGCVLWCTDVLNFDVVQSSIFAFVACTFFFLHEQFFFFKEFLYLFIYLFTFIYFWLCWVFVSVQGLSLIAASGGHSSSRCAGLSLLLPLLLRSTGSRRAGSVVVAHGPSCSASCGILPDQGSNPCLLHWQADSQPLRHQGSPRCLYFLCNIQEIIAKSNVMKLFPMFSSKSFIVLLLRLCLWSILN